MMNLKPEVVAWHGLGCSSTLCAHDKSKRCGRTALQFASHWVGRTLLKG
ncbi:hypothetical protein [Trichloromonas sp.]